MNGNVNLPVSDIARRFVVNVTITRAGAFRARLKIASWIFRLGALVAGVGCVINHKESR